MPRQFITACLCWLITTLTVEATANVSILNMEIEKENSGYWIRGKAIEAFIQTEPAIRLMVIKRPGAENLLRADNEPAGLRTWIMNPYEDLEFRDEVSKMPAEAISADNGKLTLETGISNTLSLQLVWEISLNRNEDGLVLKQTLFNRGSTNRELSVWSLAVVPDQTQISVNMDAPLRSDNPHFPYQVYIFPFSNYPDPRVAIAEDQLRIDVSQGQGSIKWGVKSASGEFKAERKNSILLSSVPMKSGQTYPEGGANMTFYLSGKRENTFGELEHMSPLQTVKPGECISLIQALKVLSKM